MAHWYLTIYMICKKICFISLPAKLPNNHVSIKICCTISDVTMAGVEKERAAEKFPVIKDRRGQWPPLNKNPPSGWKPTQWMKTHPVNKNPNKQWSSRWQTACTPPALQLPLLSPISDLLTLGEAWTKVEWWWGSTLNLARPATTPWEASLTVVADTRWDLFPLWKVS